METLPLARWSLLEKENLVRCLQGFQALDDYRVDATALMSEHCLYFLSWVMDDEGCAVEAIRSYQCLAFMEELVTLVWGRKSRKNPLKLLLELLEYEKYPALSKDRFPNGLCRHCHERLPEAVNQTRETLWKSLPNHFMVQMVCRFQPVNAFVDLCSSHAEPSKDGFVRRLNVFEQCKHDKHRPSIWIGHATNCL